MSTGSPKSPVSAAAPQQIMFHGTSSGAGGLRIRSLLKHGLTVTAPKAWANDPDALAARQRSRAAYGGIYLAADPAVAFSSVHKPRGADSDQYPVIVTVLTQPRAALPDEDDYTHAVDSALNYALNASVNDFLAALYFVLVKLPTDEPSITEERARFSEALLDRVKRLAGVTDKLPMKLFKDVTDKIFEAEIVRRVSHFSDDEYRRLVQYRLSDALRVSPSEIPEEAKALFEKKPTVEEGEALFRSAVDRLTRLTKRAALGAETESTRFRHTLRVMNSITFSGKTRIISIVSLPNYFKRFNSSDEKELLVVSHYGDPSQVMKYLEKQGYPTKIVRTNRVSIDTATRVARVMAAARSKLVADCGGSKPITLASVKDTVAKVMQEASKEGIHTALTGGLAMQVYGSHRTTEDVDLLASAVPSVAQGGSVLNIGGISKCIDGVSIDFLVQDDEYVDLYEDAVKHAINAPGAPGVRVVSAEHLIAIKMTTGRTKDDTDYFSLLSATGKYDKKKLVTLVKRFLGPEPARRIGDDISIASLMRKKGMLSYPAREQATSPHVGSSFDSFLEEEGLLEEVNAAIAHHLLGYKVMRYDPATKRFVSGADGRQSFPAESGQTVTMRAPGIFLSTNKQYVLDYYTGHDHEALLTFEFDPADITRGNTTDRENEFAVPTAKLVDVEFLQTEDEASLNSVVSTTTQASVFSEAVKASQLLSADETGNFWGNEGAGALFLAEDTGRILLQHRSPWVHEPGTWGIYGGAIDSDEDPTEALRREVEEEAGYTGQMAIEPLHVFQSGKFRYHNFLVRVPHEFEPKHNWETQGHKWTMVDDLPSPLHFGVLDLLPALKKELGHDS